MLRSQSDVKFDTGDKEESGCLSANPARGLRWVLVPSPAGAEEEQGSRWLAASSIPGSCVRTQWGGGRRCCQWGRKARSCAGTVTKSLGNHPVFTERRLFVCILDQLSTSERSLLEVL